MPRRSILLVTNLVVVTLLSCTSPGDFPNLDVTIGDGCPTVVTVRWDAKDAESVEAQVILSGGTTAGRTVTATRTGDYWEAVVLGLAPDSTYSVVVSMSTSGEPFASTSTEITTGSLPPSMPLFSVDQPEAASSRGGYLLTSFISIPSAAVLIDLQGGTYVWWYVEQHDDTSIRRAHIAHDRSSMLMLSSDAQYYSDVDHASELLDMDLDGGDVGRITIDGFHHDFLELPDGSIALIQKDQRLVQEDPNVSVAGDQIVELRPDGGLDAVWSIWDTPAYEHGEVHDIMDGESHANALRYVPETDTYYLGSRNLHAIFAIDRAAQETLWQFGGDHSDFATADGSTALTSFQHQFDPLDDSLLIFDNGNDYEVGTRIVEYDISQADGTTEVVWEHYKDPLDLCYALGDVRRFEDGHTLVTWSTAGVIEEVDADGESIWRLSMPLGTGLGYTTWFEALNI